MAAPPLRIGSEGIMIIASSGGCSSKEETGSFLQSWGRFVGSELSKHVMGGRGRGRRLCNRQIMSGAYRKHVGEKKNKKNNLILSLALSTPTHTSIAPGGKKKNPSKYVCPRDQEIHWRYSSAVQIAPRLGQTRRVCGRNL